MTSTGTPASEPRVSIADAFLAALATGELDRLGELFEPDATLNALLPEGLREWHGPERIVRAFVVWFGRADDYELLDTAIGQAGPRLQMRWRARVRGGVFGDATLVVEQHVYADAGPSGRIQSMAMLCSGFTEERSDV